MSNSMMILIFGINSISSQPDVYRIELHRNYLIGADFVCDADSIGDSVRWSISGLVLHGKHAPFYGLIIVPHSRCSHQDLIVHSVVVYCTGSGWICFGLMVTNFFIGFFVIIIVVKGYADITVCEMVCPLYTCTSYRVALSTQSTLRTESTDATASEATYRRIKVEFECKRVTICCF